VTDVQEVE